MTTAEIETMGFNALDSMEHVYTMLGHLCATADFAQEYFEETNTSENERYNYPAHILYIISTVAEAARDALDQSMGILSTILPLRGRLETNADKEGKAQ